MLNTKNIILFAVSLVLLVFVFVYFGNNGTSSISSGLSTQAASGGSQVAAFLRQISAIKTIELNREIFNNPMLISGLKDQSREIAEQPRGRDNPFAPLGRQVFVAPPPSVVAPVVTPDVITSPPNTPTD
jgi:hypothetical protein